MEEELNENELEERFYSMLYYVDATPDNNTPSSQDASKIVESAPRSSVRRYWRTSSDHAKENTTPHKENTTFRKVNPPKEAPNSKNNTDKNINQPKAKENNTDKNTQPKPKVEKQNLPADPPPSLPAIFKSQPQNVIKSVEIIDDVEQVVELESSDEDEVVEVVLPPKPTITIESSDEDDVKEQPVIPSKDLKKSAEKIGEREVSASPVPSVVSSISDEFIRGDCIALNISSKHPDNHSFDFSLHGAEFLNQSTPAKKKKKKKNKETVTPPMTIKNVQPPNSEGYFATPKSKAKNKRQKTKSFTVTEAVIPNPDVYDSDSNQSIIDKTQSYIVSEKSLPNADVYESDSSETIRNTLQNVNNQKNTIDVDSSDSSASLDKTPSGVKRKNSTIDLTETTVTIVDSTDNSDVPHGDIQENIMMANVSGFTESDDYGEEFMPPPKVPRYDITEYESTKIPAILYEDLDFDNLKGKDKVCKNRRYSLTSLRAEMEKFYNESWGGENFNHREIQKNMSRDKSLWAIDPKDKIPSYGRQKSRVICNYCHRPGHRDDSCRQKPPVCYMCGNVGHIEPRCPSKICVNCGAPNFVYSTMCRNCSTWGRLKCAECGQFGHPTSHCPDMWRRYHNTIELSPLEESRGFKKYNQMFCSGCTRRGHLVHTCRLSLPFSGLPINSPYVNRYRPVYPITETEFQNLKNRMSQAEQTSSAATPNKNGERHKRQSKSPTLHETHVNKRKMVETPEVQRNTKSPLSTAHQRKTAQSKDVEVTDKAKDTNITITSSGVADKRGVETDKAPDFIPIGSSNHDKKGQMIQYNEVSDTSDVVTSARFYLTNEMIEKLKTKQGEEWLKETIDKLHLTIENKDINTFLSIKGKVGDQEVFQSMLRNWINPEGSKNSQAQNISAQEIANDMTNNISRYKNNVLRLISKSLQSLKRDLGDPVEFYKELNYLQNRHAELKKQKNVNPKQLYNNRNNINDILKKLNMILIGQAGLANGWKHINELYSLQEKLIKQRQKTITLEFRKIIGQHYHSIFSNIPRNDYEELLKSYQVVKKPKPTFKKNKDKLFMITPKKKKLFQAVAPTEEATGPQHYKNPKKSFIGRNIRQKLIIYQQKLQNTEPNDKKLVKKRLMLVNKLNNYIASLYRDDKTSPKMLKKLRQVQEQAKVFLKNM